MFSQSLSCAQLFVTPQTGGHHAPLTRAFSRQEYWSILLLFPTPVGPLDPGIKPTSLVSPALAGRFFATSAPWEAHDTQQNWKKTWSQGLPVPSSCDCWHDKMMTVIKKKKTEGGEGVGGGREVQEGGDVCIPVADSCC